MRRPSRKPVSLMLLWLQAYFVLLEKVFQVNNCAEISTAPYLRKCWLFLNLFKLNSMETVVVLEMWRAGGRGTFLSRLLQVVYELQYQKFSSVSASLDWRVSEWALKLDIFLICPQVLVYSTGCFWSYAVGPMPATPWRFSVCHFSCQQHAAICIWALRTWACWLPAFS